MIKTYLINSIIYIQKEMLKIFLIDDEPTQNFVNRIQLEENISFRNKIIEYTDPEKTIKVILEEENILD